MPNQKGLISITPELLRGILKSKDTWLSRYLHIEQMLLGQGVDCTHVRDMTKEEIESEAKETWLSGKVTSQ